jgi:hypothetical protein
VECGVEARDRGHTGQAVGDRGQRGEGLGLVQRSQVSQFPQLLRHRVGDQDRSGKDRPAVHDPVADRIWPTRVTQTPAPQDFAEVGGIDPIRPGGQVGAVLDGVLGVEQARLEDPALTTSTRIVRPVQARSSR